MSFYAGNKIAMYFFHQLRISVNQNRSNVIVKYFRVKWSRPFELKKKQVLQTFDEFFLSKVSTPKKNTKVCPLQ